MRTIHHKPVARGVTQLMYVGDDAAVEGVLSSVPTAVKIAGVALLAWLLLRE